MGKQAERCALYLRLSKEDEKGTESASIDTQRRILQEFADGNGFQIYREYVDDGYTGTNMERPALQRMLQDIEGGRIDVVLTKDLSRLGRNIGRVSMMLDEFFPQHRVRFISVGEGFDTAERSSLHSMVVPIQNMVNELYAGDISRKIRAAFEIRMKEGAFIGAFAPYGYQKDSKNKNRLQIDESAGAVVRRMFAMAKEGYSPSQIAAVYNAEGIPTPSQYRYQRCVQPDGAFTGALEWKGTNISKMLRNEVYLGHMLQGKTEKQGFKSRYSRTKPKTEWIVVEHTHEPLVDLQTWGIVRERMRSRAEKREKGFVNLFSGLAKCADCGRNMSTVATRKKGAAANLNCGGYKQGGRKNCTSHSIDYDVLCQAVRQALQEHLRLSETEKRHLLKRLWQNMDGQRSEELQKKLAATEHKLERLFIDRYDGLIGEKSFERLYQRYHEEQKELKKRIEQGADDKRQEQLDILIDNLEDLKTLDASLLFQLIERIDIHQAGYREGRLQQHIDIWFRFCCEAKTFVIDPQQKRRNS